MRCTYCGAEMRETRLRESAPQVALWACPACGAFCSESALATPAPTGPGAEGEVRVARRVWQRGSGGPVDWAGGAEM